MTNPVVILAPYWRRMAELFSTDREAELRDMCTVIWGQDGPIPESDLETALPEASVLIAATPTVSAATLAQAPGLKAVIEVSGSFPDTIDYAACEAKGIEVLSCSPGFRSSVAEMGLAMALAGARGLVAEHEAFRRGQEGWLQDNPQTDFSLYGARIGFVGFGQIARELRRLMAPFRPQVRAYDPWLPTAVAGRHNVGLCGLDELARWSRCLFITAVPTTENEGLVSADILKCMHDHSLVILLSRAHVVEFDALVQEAASGRIRVAADVFPIEPVAPDHPVRQLGNIILSPHRAAAVAGGRQGIGDLIVNDLRALFSGNPARRLARSHPGTIGRLAGTGDTNQVAGLVAANG